MAFRGRPRVPVALSLVITFTSETLDLSLGIVSIGLYAQPSHVDTPCTCLCEGGLEGINQHKCCPTDLPDIFGREGILCLLSKYNNDGGHEGLCLM